MEAVHVDVDRIDLFRGVAAGRPAPAEPFQFGVVGPDGVGIDRRFQHPDVIAVRPQGDHLARQRGVAAGEDADHVPRLGAFPDQEIGCVGHPGQGPPGQAVQRAPEDPFGGGLGQEQERRNLGSILPPQDQLGAAKVGLALGRHGIEFDQRNPRRAAQLDQAGRHRGRDQPQGAVGPSRHRQHDQAAAGLIGPHHVRAIAHQAAPDHFHAIQRTHPLRCGDPLEDEVVVLSGGQQLTVQFQPGLVRHPVVEERDILKIASAVSARPQPHPLQLGADVGGRLHVAEGTGLPAHHGIIGQDVVPGHEVPGRDGRMGRLRRVLQRQGCLGGEQAEEERCAKRKTVRIISLGLIADS